MEPLPVLLSIPHGGYQIPAEIAERVCITPHDLHNDSDAYTVDIYNLKTKVAKVIYTDIARAFVDLNRAADDRPPTNPDGVVKTATCFNKPIYKPGLELTDALTEKLLNKYYFPYHDRIKKACQQPDIRLALDCHSMVRKAPAIAPDSSVRPIICLGNRGGRACSYGVTQKLADCFRQVFSLEKQDVTINQPFSGGYITRTYGNNPLPWIQVEINRSLYLDQPWFDRDNLIIDKKRLRELNHLFEKTLRLFFQIL